MFKKLFQIFTNTALFSALFLALPVSADVPRHCLLASDPAIEVLQTKMVKSEKGEDEILLRFSVESAASYGLDLESVEIELWSSDFATFYNISIRAYEDAKFTKAADGIETANGLFFIPYNLKSTKLFRPSIIFNKDQLESQRAFELNSEDRTYFEVQSSYVATSNYGKPKATEVKARLHNIVWSPVLSEFSSSNAVCDRQYTMNLIPRTETSENMHVERVALSQPELGE